MPKPQARTTVQERFSVMSDAEYYEHCKSTLARIASWLDQTAQTDTIKRILLYRAFPDWYEIPLDDLRARFPAIIFDDAPTTKHRPFPPGQYDVIFVPLHGFNDSGYRLGRGGGWYDRFLVTQKAARAVGVGLEAARIDFTSEDHDVRMDVIITEDRLQILQKRTGH